MFGAYDTLAVIDVELLIQGINNVFDRMQPSRVIKDGKKLLDVSTVENFAKFHKKLLPWLDIKLHTESEVRKLNR